jgi:hypothetical protein
MLRSRRSRLRGLHRLQQTLLASAHKELLCCQFLGAVIQELQRVASCMLQNVVV